MAARSYPPHPAFRRASRTTALALASLLLAACVSSRAAAAGAVVVGADNPAIQYSGRSAGLGTPVVTFGYSGARMRLRFDGTSVSMRMDDDSGLNYAMAWIDGKPGQKFRLDAKDGVYPLAAGQAPGAHTVEVVRVTECNLGLTRFRGFLLSPGGKALPWPQGPDRKIEFIGDSITCGYGVEADDPHEHFSPATENFCLGYSGLTARALDADYLVVARSGIGMVRDYNGPYEGSKVTIPGIYPETFYEQPEPKWDFHRFTPDVVCVNLGTNDFSTTGVDVEKFVATYIEFCGRVLRRYPRAQLVVLQGPMNNTPQLKAALGRVVSRLTKDAPGRVHYFELSAEGKVGYGADYHPNRAQSKINARELTAYLRRLMGWR